MYLPKRFEIEDVDLALDVMRTHPFATVTTVEAGQPFINHLPVTASKLPDGGVRLIGHMARMNDQWKHMKTGGPVVIAFHGPHAYINPSWYPERDAVPTWNYVTVHAHGTAQVIEDGAGLISILRETVDHMNLSYDDQWNFGLPSYLKTEAALEKAIVGFEIMPHDLKAKFKLSQHRADTEIRGAIEGLRERDDAESRATADWMQLFLDRKTR